MSDPRDMLIAKLEAENDMLRERVAAVEQLLVAGVADVAPIDVHLLLTPSESVVFGVLLRRETVRKDQIMAALYRDFGKDEAEPKIVDVFICKLRRKLLPHGIKIKTMWGQGYFIDAETKRRLVEKRDANAA